MRDRLAQFRRYIFSQATFFSSLFRLFLYMLIPFTSQLLQYEPLAPGTAPLTTIKFFSAITFKLEGLQL